MSEIFVTSTMYFSRPGPANTKPLLAHAAARARELGIRKVVIASCTGATVEAAVEHFSPKDFELIVVTHVTGFKEPDHQEMKEETRQEIEALGIKVLTAAHAFGGVGRGIRVKLGTFQVDEVMGFTLRMLGQGVKVGLEMACLVADRGWVRTDEDIVTIAGTGRGADTALVVRPAPSANCLEAKVKEIMAKPWNP